MLTILEPASNRKLTTAAAAKLELQVSGGGDDAYLTMLIEQASQAITSWCQREFAIETVREVVRSTRAGESIMLSRWPVLQVTAVAINDAAELVANLEADDDGMLYRLKSSGCRATWPRGRTILKYRAGYVLPGAPGRTLPADIERAALSLIKAQWHARGRDPLIRSEAIEGAGSTDYFAGTVSQLPLEVENLLAPYRNLTIG